MAVYADSVTFLAPMKRGLKDGIISWNTPFLTACYIPYPDEKGTESGHYYSQLPGLHLTAVTFLAPMKRGLKGRW